jgi:hypothetical protein
MRKSIDQRCEEMKPELTKEVRRHLMENKTAFEPLIEDIRKLVRLELHRKAEQARVLIGTVATLHAA